MISRLSCLLWCHRTGCCLSLSLNYWSPTLFIYFGSRLLPQSPKNIIVLTTYCLTIAAHSHSHSHSHSQAAELAMSSFYTPAELHTIAESLLAAVAAHSSASASSSSTNTTSSSFSMLSQSPARSPLALPSSLPAMSSAAAAAAGGAVRPSAARRFEGKESTRRHSHDLRAMHYHHQLDGERDRRGRDIQVKGLKK